MIQEAATGTGDICAMNLTNLAMALHRQCGSLKKRHMKVS